MIILVAGSIVIFCVICRLSMLTPHTPRIAVLIGAYLGMAGWASARGLEVLAGLPHTWTDTAGVTACAIYLIADMPRWKRGVPADMQKHSS